ncbi:hypothetical protein CRE_06691 [Caenorhabditis remanei]|uniref:Serpentine receptor class gamma n=1 Tax=Caenorhabditis remanei TaxID=31234 RepID=E3M0Z8_CAERE|nr:hypothetical protein CRE_06691 [Caenorhabditis remanei]
MSSIFTDSFPIDCDTSFNPFIEILKYLGTVFYLVIGLILHFSLLRTIFVSEKSFYKNNSFFHIYAMDSIASSLIILADILFNRLFMFVTPLCPIVGPWFFSPSYVAKFVYILGNHARFSKSVAQIFMVLNRMSCVLSPVGYNQLWKNLLPVARVFIVIVPFVGTWNLWISRTLIIPEFGGFALSYTRNVKWAALSLFQSIFILTALGFTVICTCVTLYRMVVLQERIKVAEKSLCFTSIFISITFLLVAATQILWVTCCGNDLMYAIQFIAFDTFTVGSAVIVIVVNKQLRNSIFSWKSTRVKTNSIMISVAPT